MLSFQLSAQKTWSDDVAEIFYSKCAACHNPNGAGPFSVLDYTTTVANSGSIKYEIEAGNMPPWPVDTSYTRFRHERVLTPQELSDIVDWIDEGTAEGDPTTAPPPPVFNSGAILSGTPDLSVRIPDYKSNATSGSDDYVCFVIPSGLTSDKIIRAMEIIPGNPEIVHHVFVYADEAGSSSTDTVGGDCVNPPTTMLIGAFVPGSTPVEFPITDNFKSGFPIPSGADIILSIHYPEGSLDELDSTRVNFFFYDDSVTDVRQVYNQPLLENWSFFLLPNAEKIVKASYNVKADYSLIGVGPHMHKLGKEIKSYGITEEGDTIPFINIPDWDFEWQGGYEFKKLIKIPSGTKLKAEGMFDNTTTQIVIPGLNTSDEMFLVYFGYMEYEVGDEFVILDSTYFDDVLTIDEKETKLSITTRPNPFKNSVSIEYQLVSRANVLLYIYDLNGRLIKKLLNANQSAGNQNVIWSGTNDNGASVSNGVYIYSMNVDGVKHHGKLVKTN